MGIERGRKQESRKFDARRDVGGVFLAFGGGFTALSLASYDPYDPSLLTFSSSAPVFLREQAQNWGGIIGATWADLLAQFFGLASYVLPVVLVVVGVRLLLRSTLGAHLRSSALLVAIMLWVCLATYLVAPLLRAPLLGMSLPSGLLGFSLGQALEHLLNRAGTALAVLFLGAVTVMAGLRASPAGLVERCLEWGREQLVEFWALARSLGGVIRRTAGPTVKLKTDATPAESEGVNRQLGGALAQVLAGAEGAGAEWDEDATEGENDDEASSAYGTTAEKRRKRPSLAAVPAGYEMPPVALLEPPVDGTTTVDTRALEEGSKLLEEKLRDFGVNGKVQKVEPGPVVSMYELEPAPGVKISQVANLADDLALAMRCGAVRIVAPIPGKGVVGIEIPNPKRQTVYLREILESEGFRSATSPLTLALGKDITGEPVSADLAKMPHLLVAGATGSGKSVALNAMILSLMARATPREVRLLLIDPKVLEFSCYNDVPHLIAPVVTDAKKAKFALMWAVREMERRYQRLAELGVRNLEAYNHKLTKGGKQLQLELGGDPPHEPMPFLVVVVDELADLMMVAAKEVEDSIARLAQMARAAGIHLIVATQRPSVDVITGTIKANFSTRIAFQVTQRVDSRTILDTGGAEHLLGQGDMLYLPPGSAKVIRIHGPLVTDKEIKEVVHFLKKQAKPEYVEGILGGESEEDGDEMPLGEADEELYARAVEFVRETGYVSTSSIQRRFRIGYNRAARLVEAMQREGVISQAEGGLKPRQVL